MDHVLSNRVRNIVVFALQVTQEITVRLISTNVTHCPVSIMAHAQTFSMITLVAA